MSDSFDAFYSNLACCIFCIYSSKFANIGLTWSATSFLVFSSSIGVEVSLGSLVSVAYLESSEILIAERIDILLVDFRTSLDIKGYISAIYYV
jgi:hypothetical protein